MARSYWFMLRRNLWWLVVLTLLLAPLPFYLLTSSTPQYQSTAVIEVTFGTTADQLLGQQRGYEEPERRVATEAELVQSLPVASLTAERLGLPDEAETHRDLLEHVEAAPRRGTNYIEIDGVDPDSERAQALTQAFAESYLEYRLTLQQGNLVQLEEDLLEVRADTQATAPQSDEIDRLLDAVRLRLAVDAPGAILLSEASLPDMPANTVGTGTAVAIALLGSLLLVLALLTLLELLRDSVHGPEEAERLVAAPVVANLVLAARSRWPRAGRAAELLEERSLRMRLALPSVERAPVILVTSLGADAEHCVLVAQRLAATWGRMGHRVLLAADEDLSTAAAPRSRLAGLSSTTPATDLERVGVTRLRVTATAGAGGIFDAPDVEALLGSLASDHDFVLLAVPDIEALHPVDAVPFVDSTVVVCAVGRTRGRKLQRFATRLRAGGATIQGVVLTEVRSRRPARPAGRPLPDALPAGVGRGEAAASDVLPTGGASGRVTSVRRSATSPTPPGGAAASRVAPAPATGASAHVSRVQTPPSPRVGRVGSSPADLGTVVAERGADAPGGGSRDERADERRDP
jgi:hypothetical protein